jgi:hypothetical protein
VLDNFDAMLAEQSIINRVQTTAAALEAIAQHVAHVPGRKNLDLDHRQFSISIGQYNSAEAGANPNDRVMTPVTIKRSAASSRARRGRCHTCRRGRRRQRRVWHLRSEHPLLRSRPRWISWLRRRNQARRARHQ